MKNSDKFDELVDRAYKLNNLHFEDAAMRHPLETKVGSLKKIVATLKQALEIDSSDYRIVNFLADTFQDLALLFKVKGSKEEQALFLRLSIEEWEKSLNMMSHHRLLYKWMDSLEELLPLLPDMEKKNYLEKAEKAHKNFIETNSTCYECYVRVPSQLVTIFLELAKLSVGEEKMEYLEKAAKIHEKMLETNPDDTSSLYQTGYVLQELAKMSWGEKKESYLKQSLKIYKKVLKNGSNFVSLCHCGDTLSWLADVSPQRGSVEEKNYYIKALEMYKEASKILPDNYDLLTGTKHVLQKLADRTEGGEQKKYFKQVLDVELILQKHLDTKTGRSNNVNSKEL